MSGKGKANDASLRGDLAQAVACETNALAWEPSPGGEVLRKRLHRVGPAESGQVTSLVRYPAGARFPAHDHPEGEEILVLDGVFSDEHGDWPAGSYLLNPEGFRHAPFSEAGCVIFVKLRQYAGQGRRHVALSTHELPWRPTAEPGVEEKALYRDAAFPDSTQLERWQPGAGVLRSFPDGAEVWAIEGAYEDESGKHGPGSWQRLPSGARWRASSADGCTLYLKEGGVASLRGG